MLRSAAFAFAAVIASLAAPAQAETPAAQCDAMTVRVYFQHGSASLTPEAMQMLDAAARNMAGCTHTEMHVTIGSGRLASARGAAIMTAMNGHGFDVAQIDARSMTQMASMSTAPEFVEVLMTSDTMPMTNTASPLPNAGV